ncbi:unnamed protein product [Moneuplotes crassus]|uniref:UBC core domain-containing protein n=1 Tax=Euplotes crassus TaxID=5936 RepID=A0AAD2D4V4_EUPCR|nr:unnamed protein product [Moneuplotes crassus]
MESSSKYAMEILSKELERLQTQDDIGASIGLVDDEDLFNWNVIYEGPSDTLYEGGFFKALIKFPEDYPNNPPEMRFVTEMWHPNIYPDGKVCISILHPPGEDEFNEQESADERWRPILGVESILISVISMLNDPNLDSPANIDAAKQFKEEREAYEKKVKKLTQLSVEML